MAQSREEASDVEQEWYQVHVASMSLKRLVYRAIAVCIWIQIALSLDPEIMLAYSCENASKNKPLV